MQLTLTTFLSAGPGGPDEDRSGGFRGRGWLVPHFDEATGQFIDSVFERVDAFMLVELDTYTFEDLGEQTGYRSVSIFQSVEDRDAMVRAGAESGAREGLDRFSELYAQK